MKELEFLKYSSADLKKIASASPIFGIQEQMYLDALKRTARQVNVMPVVEVGVEPNRYWQPGEPQYLLHYRITNEVDNATHEVFKMEIFLEYRRTYFLD